ncbi:terminase large subunit [Vibrio phage K394]
MTPLDRLNEWYFQHDLSESEIPTIRTTFEKVYAGVEYAYAVVNGKRVACQLTINACQRFIDDFSRDDYNGAIKFDFDAAFHVILFYSHNICHVKGKWAGKPIDLMDWHAFILISLFGWKSPQYLEDEETGEVKLDDTGNKIPVLTDDGAPSWVRRFKTAYVEVARKNAKSTVSSGIGLYMTEADGEGGAEVYSAATTKDQARIVFGDAKEMIRKSPNLSKKLGHHKLNIHHIESGSKFEPLSADANTLDGLNIHCGIVDELHAHKTRDVWDVLETATGAREQPLILGITTAGFILDGICYEIRDYAKKVLQKTIEDDSFFGVIYTLDEDDDPFDESVWFKANPGLGICKKWDDLRRLAKKAKEQVSARPNFLTKHMNVWVRGETTWMNMDKWEACGNSGSEPTDLTWIGVDLAQKIDISAAIKVKLGLDNKVHLWCKFWIPEERLDNCPRQMAELYRKWANDGYLELTDGAVIDQDVIKLDLDEWVTGENLQEIAYDPWSATQFALSLMEDGKPVVEVPQSTKNLSEAMKQSEAMVYSGNVLHDHNPVMTWMMSNVCVKEDKNGNIFPLKERVENKIDGPVAWFTAMSRVILGEAEQKNDLSWYDDDDIICF